MDITGGKKGVPEWIFFIHIQASGNTDGHSGMDDLRIAVKQKFIFLMVHVFTFAAIVFTIGKYLLTPVSGVILLSVAKLITGDKTLIITTLATQKTRRVLRFRYNLIQTD